MKTQNILHAFNKGTATDYRTQNSELKSKSEFSQSKQNKNT